MSLCLCVLQRLLRLRQRLSLHWLLGLQLLLGLLLLLRLLRLLLLLLLLLLLWLLLRLLLLGLQRRRGENGLRRKRLVHHSHASLFGDIILQVVRLREVIAHLLVDAGHGGIVI